FAGEHACKLRDFAMTSFGGFVFALPGHGLDDGGEDLFLREGGTVAAIAEAGDDRPEVHCEELVFGQGTQEGGKIIRRTTRQTVFRTDRLEFTDRTARAGVERRSDHRFVVDDVCMSSHSLFDGCSVISRCGIRGDYRRGERV